MLLLAISVARAQSLADPTVLLVGRELREAEVPVLFGASGRDAVSLARMASILPESAAGDPIWRQDLAPELSWLRSGQPWRAATLTLRPHADLALGSLGPDLANGDEEPGLLSARVSAPLSASFGPMIAVIDPEPRLDLAPISASLGLPVAWVGVDTTYVEASFGCRPRQLGPGRHGSLMLTDNARPAPMGSVAGRIRGRGGSARLELGAGWLDAPRQDVNHPGWLLMDARYAPVPWVELGASRVGIFGGEGRPAPRLGQLILPTDPHVSNDPDQLQPDQDDIAALDIRVLVPLKQAAPLRYLEMWWQYGGEDMIVHHWNNLPYPSLAGVANLGGAELAVGDALVSFEGARILDDTFRWYTGHRVYHDGFTQAERPMAHPAGGDAIDAWGALTWLPGRIGGQLSFERRLRVGVVTDADGRILALATDELRQRGDLELWLRDDGAWWRLGLGLERVAGEDFVPGAESWTWRAALTRQGAPKARSFRLGVD